MIRNILIAAAWPYANGSLHLGHGAALIGADVLARYFRLNGDSVLFVSGSDCHGTPIALEAAKQNVSPKIIADKYHQEFIDSLINGLSFSYDNYSKTSNKYHAEIVQEIFLDLYKKGFIYKKTEELPYCNSCQRFLPDRYIEGECPICGFSSARGDQCDSCGNLMDVKKIVKPFCKICNSSPIWKDSEHFFLKLTAFQEDLKKWVENSSDWRINAKNFTLEFLKQGLIDRAITRDTDWGVDIPMESYEDKKIYVWFEAVCGYFSASKEWSILNNKNDSWKDFWQNDQAIHYYVHGKDNIPFHSIIWPAILMGKSNLHLPDRIVSSEYLTLEKKQFSKSRNFAVWLPDFLKDFDSDTLRYYLVANGSETSDSDFSWKEFAIKVNTELIGNFGNYVYRVLSFIKKNFPDGLDFPVELNEHSSNFLNLAKKTFENVSLEIEKSNFRKALKAVFELVEEGNRFINQSSPWTSIKTDKNLAADDLVVAAHVIKSLAILISPFLPKTSDKIFKDLTLSPDNKKWQYPKEEKIIVSGPKILFQRIDDETLDKQLELLNNIK